MRLTSRAVWAALLIGIGFVLAASPGEAQTRRAFVVGIKNYRDAGIQQLSLATQDAEGIAYDLDRLLDGVYLDLLPISLESDDNFTETAGWLRDVWGRRGVGGAEVSGSLGADPLATDYYADALSFAPLVKQTVEGIRAAGVDHAFVSSDTGQMPPFMRPIGSEVANAALVTPGSARTSASTRV